eukprot:5861572-Pyramimonas_sp.AAC.1
MNDHRLVQQAVLVVHRVVQRLVIVLVLGRRLVRVLAQLAQQLLTLSPAMSTRQEDAQAQAEGLPPKVL